MSCRQGCGACCVAPSISSFIPGMPGGKPAGTPCLHLLPDKRCAIFESPERPKVCAAFRADLAVCGSSAEEAMQILGWLESETA
ncbi:hypothetical protein SAMN05216421_0775 [Halopseudomonas xinjiangensis]|uniref:YkgJ family cysteine cluster protein n=1 Tax=Halopseudomonas xinjiangensis TaxID=487184 RepID=A0A1H1NVE9_9GAMM|nr:YkgJ family cysteine cluster protein [Halopseudomonas xinjiangensis]SDS02948.1 hypothetical protein SAMN05216421_0775 [Halopseudomonas xinjiangensis]